MGLHPEKELQRPQDLSHHWSYNAKSRAPSAIKQFYKYFAIPGIAQLAGGMPHNTYFPFDTLESKTALPDRFKPTPNRPVDPPSVETQSGLSGRATSSRQPPEAHLVVPHDDKTVDQLKKIDLTSALQYGTAQGYPPLYYFVRQFTREVLYKEFPYAGGPEVILTCGATDGFNKALQLLTDEWIPGRNNITEKQGLLCEEFCYMNAVQSARPRGMNVVPVTVDDEGMKASGPGGLKQVLESWDSSKGKRPSIIYTVTIGQNPTGGVLSVTRRKEIYALCQQYDIIIVEDDPYWYLQYPSANPQKFQSRVADPSVPERQSTGYPFLDSLVPSYISIDTDGRVIRLDTFSKTVAPGCRLGWITAQPAFIERIQRITETSTQQPSGFVQSIIAELLMGPSDPSEGDGRGGAKDGNGWHADGWVRWLEGLRGNYERRMNTMCAILDRGKEMVKSGRRNSLTELVSSDDGEAADDWSVVEKTVLYDFDWPLGGMFIWLHLNLQAHPLHGKVDGARLSRAQWVFWTTDPYKILVSPGTIFAPTEEIAASSAYEYFRVCFAAIDEEALADASRRFALGARAFFRIKDKSVIDELLHDAEEGTSGMDLHSRLVERTDVDMTGVAYC